MSKLCYAAIRCSCYWATVLMVQQTLPVNYTRLSQRSTKMHKEDAQRCDNTRFLIELSRQ